MAVVCEGHNTEDLFCPPCHRISSSNFASRDELIIVVFKGIFDYDEFK